jgi:hypothetical protein
MTVETNDDTEPLNIMYLYIHNYVYVYFKDLSPDELKVYTIFHFILSCDPADQIVSANFCDIKISIFRRDFHSFNCCMISSRTLTYRIEIQFCPFLSVM